MAHRFVREGEPGHDAPILTEYDGSFIHDAPQFNGVVIPRPDRLDIPLKRRKPTVYSVWNDLFHEDVQDEFLFDALNVMERCSEGPAWGERVYQYQFDTTGSFVPHTFLILTKRARRMAYKVDEWLSSYSEQGTAANIAHIYFGLTVCNQQEADEKIPAFLQVPGKKFLSIEPMLGPVDITQIRDGHTRDHVTINALTGIPYDWDYDEENPDDGTGKINAVILGGETGPGARPMHPDWVRSIRDQCEAAGVPFFFKQWGEFEPWDHRKGTDAVPNVLYVPYRPDCPDPYPLGWGRRVGRNKAGRLLDGREHNDLPWGPPPTQPENEELTRE